MISNASIEDRILPRCRAISPFKPLAFYKIKRTITPREKLGDMIDIPDSRRRWNGHAATGSAGKELGPFTKPQKNPKTISAKTRQRLASDDGRAAMPQRALAPELSCIRIRYTTSNAGPTPICVAQPLNLDDFQDALQRGKVGRIASVEWQSIGRSGRGYEQIREACPA